MSNLETLTKDNAAVGMFIRQGTIMGNLHLQQIVSISDEDGRFTITTRYTREMRAVYRTYYHLIGKYAEKYLVIIKDPVDFLAHNWLCEQALDIMKSDWSGLGRTVFYRMAGMVMSWVVETAHPNNKRIRGDWKEEIDGKMWEMTEYEISDSNWKIRNCRSWCKQTRQYNGDSFWCVVEPNGDRQEWTDLRTVLIRLALWFDDEHYID